MRPVPHGFKKSSGLVQSTAGGHQDDKDEATLADSLAPTNLQDDGPTNVSTAASVPGDIEKIKKMPRKFFQEEKRAVDRVAWDVWSAYIAACSTRWYSVLFALVFIIAAIAPLVENGWLSYWSRGDDSNSPIFYLGIYAAVSPRCLLRWLY